MLCNDHQNEVLVLRKRRTTDRLIESPTAKTQRRPRCDWADGCSRRAELLLPSEPGKLFCREHAAAARPGLRSFLGTLDNYTNDSFIRDDVGLMCDRCEECGAQNFERERVGPEHARHFRLCCQNGKLSHINKPPFPPLILAHYLKSPEMRARNFRERIREYNSALSFVSFGAEMSTPPGHGPKVFRLHGSIYHASAALEPEPQHEGKYAQVYLYDPGEALNLRAKRNPELSRETLDELQTMLEEVSPFVEAYRHMRDVALANDTGSVTLGFAANTDGDLRRYNRPTQREVAAVFGGEDGAPPSNRDIVVWPREEAAYRVNERNDLIDPLTYALLFPDGTAGWSETLKHREDKQTKKYTRVTAAQFYANRIMVFAPDEPFPNGTTENPVPHAAHLLFQQYLVLYGLQVSIRKNSVQETTKSRSR